VRLRIISFVIVLAIGVLAVMAWNRNTARTTPAADAAGSSVDGTGSPAPPADVAPPMGAESSAPAGDPGVEWRVPKRWVAELSGGMRLATYAIPAPPSGGDVAKCAVYYFGPGQGGSVEANIERWIGEFENAGPPARHASRVSGLRVSQVEVSGTYMAHAGAQEGSAGTATGWTLLGAIVEGPKGAVFFKLTGPSATVAPAAAEFTQLLRSLRKQG
jgi:hypothetical protein